MVCTMCPKLTSRTQQQGSNPFRSPCKCRLQKSHFPPHCASHPATEKLKAKPTDSCSFRPLSLSFPIAQGKTLRQILSFQRAACASFAKIYCNRVLLQQWHYWSLMIFFCLGEGFKWCLLVICNLWQGQNLTRQLFKSYYIRLNIDRRRRSFLWSHRRVTNFCPPPPSSSFFHLKVSNFLLSQKVPRNITWCFMPGRLPSLQLLYNPSWFSVVIWV